MAGGYQLKWRSFPQASSLYPEDTKAGGTGRGGQSMTWGLGAPPRKAVPAGAENNGRFSLWGLSAPPSFQRGLDDAK